MNQEHPFIIYLKKIFSIDLRSLALFRISLGFVLLFDLMDRFRSLEAFYTDFGAVPRTAITEQASRVLNFSIHFMTGDLTTQAFLFAINALVILGFIFGYKARLMTFLCWFFYVSVGNRNPMVLHGGDVLTRNMLFWCMFIPMGLYYSADAALQKKSDSSKTLFSPGCVGLILQVLVVYLFSAIYKTDPQWFPDGTAVAYALQLHNFATKIGVFLRDFPNILYVLTIGTYFLELMGPLLIIYPFKKSYVRMMVILSFISMHLGIYLTMNIGMFPWMCIAIWTVFIPAEFWDKLKQCLPKKQGQNLKIYFDEDCGFCKKTVYILRNFLLLKDAHIIEAQSDPEALSIMQKENSWVVEIDEKMHIRYEAFLVLVQQSIFSKILSPLLSFKPIRFIGEKLYCWVSHNRNKAGILTSPLTWNEKTYSYSKSSIWISIFFIMLMLINNLGGIAWDDPTFKRLFQTPKIFKPINKILRTDQKWNMFAPKPTNTNGWYKISGKNLAGEKVSMLNIDPLKMAEGDQRFKEDYTNHRWSKYLRNLSQKDNKNYKSYFAKYLCRKTNRDLKGPKRLKEFTITYITQRTSVEKEYPLKENVLWTHDCN